MGITQKRNGRWAGIRHTFTVPISFVTANQGAMVVPFTRPVTIKSLGFVVTGALGGTDAGTVQASNATGNMTGGLLTVPLSSTVGTQITSVTPTTNQTIAAGGVLTLTSAKTTTGGTGYVVVEYEDS